MSLHDLLKAKRSDILRIAEKHGAHNVRIFGSVAKGEADELSDVDFLVEMEQGRSLLDLIGLGDELEDILRCGVDVITDRGVSPYLREQIYAESIKL